MSLIWLAFEGVDARVKPGHDESRIVAPGITRCNHTFRHHAGCFRSNAVWLRLSGINRMWPTWPDRRFLAFFGSRPV